jgi:diguanylate cyclase (GGDEF)-like protein/PAS domain S-box-containing protein
MEEHESGRARLYRSLVDDAFELTVVLRPDFTIELVSDSITARTGWTRDDLEGRSIAEFVHPDDLERAFVALNGFESFGAPGGTTCFRVLGADGDWLSFDLTASTATDGEGTFYAITARPVDYQHATDEVLTRLLSGAPRADALAPVLDVFSWQLNGSSVGIWWREGGKERSVTTGIPGDLAGLDDRPEGPWGRALATRSPVLDIGGELLTPEQRHLATLHDCGSVWVVPIEVVGHPEVALVTVWTRVGGPRPDGHAYGMTLARTYIDLILRWTDQAEQLDRAAHRDPLTGMANRRALFEALGEHPVSGAVLFCDLDRFKPVNDHYGHTTGDQVLRRVAQRIERAVRSRRPGDRPPDLVARTGGDEFVVLARNVTTEQAAALAQRIRSAVNRPVQVGEHLIEVGITIGVDHAEAIDDSTLAGADQALVAAKSVERGTVRWGATGTTSR